MKNWKRNLAVSVLSLGFLVGNSGCESDAQTGAFIGAGLGAIAGQAISGDTEGTLIGAGVGGGLGYMFGNESDKRKDRQGRINHEYNRLATIENELVIEQQIDSCGDYLFGNKDGWTSLNERDEAYKTFIGIMGAKADTRDIALTQVLRRYRGY